MENEEKDDSVEKLAADHWNYLQGVLEAHGVEWNTIKTCGHHYRTAFVHGFKHGIEHIQSTQAITTFQFPSDNMDLS